MKSKSLWIAAVLFTIGVNAFAQSNQKPVNEVIMSSVGMTTNTRTAATITNLQATTWGTNRVTLVFDAGTWSFETNVTFPKHTAIRVENGCEWNVLTNVIVQMNTNRFWAGPQQTFRGSGMVTGVVYGMDGCFGAHWFNAATINGLRCLGQDPDTNYWQQSQQVGGDLYGTLDNLQIRTGAVTTVEILDGTITTQDMSAATITLITNAPIPTLAESYAFFVQGTQYFTNELRDARNNYTNSILITPSYDYGNGWTNGPYGRHFLTPAAGFWEFTFSIEANFPAGLTNEFQLKMGVWHDDNNDGVMDTTDPTLVGRSANVNFNIDPYSTRGAFEAFQTVFQRQVGAGEHVYPFVYFDNYAVTNSVYIVERNLAANVSGTVIFSGLLKIRE